MIALWLQGSWSSGLVRGNPLANGTQEPSISGPLHPDATLLLNKDHSDGPHADATSSSQYSEDVLSIGAVQNIYAQSLNKGRNSNINISTPLFQNLSNHESVQASHEVSGCEKDLSIATNKRKLGATTPKATCSIFPKRQYSQIFLYPSDTAKINYQRYAYATFWRLAASAQTSERWPFCTRDSSTISSFRHFKVLISKSRNDLIAPTSVAPAFIESRTFFSIPRILASAFSSWYSIVWP